MVEKVVMLQPLEIREKAVIEDDKVVINTNLSRKDIADLLKEDLALKDFNLSQALYAALGGKEKKLKPLNMLLLQGGR